MYIKVYSHVLLQRIDKREKRTGIQYILGDAHNKFTYIARSKYKSKDKLTRSVKFDVEKYFPSFTAFSFSFLLTYDLHGWHVE